MARTSNVDELHAVALEYDHEFAFRLQLEEAMAASFSFLPSTSSSTPPNLVKASSGFSSAGVETYDKSNLSDRKGKDQDELVREFDKLKLEIKDKKLCETETLRTKEELFQRIHDQNFARELLRIPEEEWEEYGNTYEKPFGEGSSSGSATKGVFRLYFKGLVREERVKDSKVILSAVAVAICDRRDNPIYEMAKPLTGNLTSRRATELKALIEGLEAALAFGIKRITFFCDYYPVYQFVTNKWYSNQRTISTLVDKVFSLTTEFSYCRPSLIARNRAKFAFKLAGEAIRTQISGSSASSCSKIVSVTCVICLEEVDVNQIFMVDGCSHRYCFSCMKQHVEVKLLHGMVPKCPHENCKSKLMVDSCRKFLTPKFIEIMNQRIKESSIPVTSKVYCPYPKCSALMSKNECSEFARKEYVKDRKFGARKCVRCLSLFCINCKTPWWHTNMTCREYKKQNPHPPIEDAKLKSLAVKNLWRQCVKCKHMIELAEGCYHMTCRCGCEFCYTCGAEWKNKKATCSCPFFDDDYDDDEDEDDFEDDYDDDEDEDDFEDDSVYTDDFSDS